MSAPEASSLGRCATSPARDDWHAIEEDEAVRLWCGIDWGERHHDVCVVDEAGSPRVRMRIEDTVAGFSQLMALLGEQEQSASAPVTVAIETAKGLLPAALRAAGVPLVAVNPLAVSRYRDRYRPSRAKSDAGDAYVLANILRTDPDSHRPLPADSELARAIQVLARHQDAIADRVQVAGKLRSVLREYYPAFLAAFPDRASREARAILRLAPAPASGQLVRKASIAAALRRAGRTRSIPAAAAAIHAALHSDQLRQPPQVEAAITGHAAALLHQLDAAVHAAASLEQSLTTAFGRHPDAEIITSFPGLGTVLGARILAEIGDDRARFATARGLKAFAGTAPVTRASGRKIIVIRRVVRNKRLGQAAYLWALPMIAHSPKAHAHFTARREHGDSYSAAARNLANHGIGMLYHCLRTRQLYNETRAFPSQRATSGKPPATQALQETEARAHPAPGDHDNQTVTSFAPPAGQACRKTEARSA